METPIEEIEMLVEYVEIDYMNGIQLNPEYLECANKVRSWLRDAAEHCVEPSKTGPSVTEDVTYVGRACECSKTEKVYYIPFCANCGGALSRPALTLSD